VDRLTPAFILLQEICLGLVQNDITTADRDNKLILTDFMCLIVVLFCSALNLLKLLNLFLHLFSGFRSPQLLIQRDDFFDHFLVSLV
jgi:hypothetical protein